MAEQRLERLLVIEDDDGVAVLQRRALERAGFAVAVVATEDEAHAHMASERVDLVVLDYRLPGDRTGLDLYEDMKARGFSPPAIVVTGFSDEPTMIKAMRCGARDFVQKSPAYLESLAEAVDRVLRQVQLEDQLADTQARFQSFLDNGPAAIFIKDAEGRIQYANRRFETVFPHLPWRGKFDRELFPGDQAQALRDGDQTVLTSGCTAQRVDALVMPDGKTGHWLTYTFPIQGITGPTLLGVVAVDVTERTLAEEALRRSEAALRQSQKLEAIGTLAGGVAHEFNNLLQAIQGYTRYAMEGLEPESDRRQDLEQVLKASERAATLTRQLLGFGRREVLQKTDLDPNALVRDLVKMLRPLIGEQIEVSLNLDESVAAVHADPSHMQQLLMNLCLNARDAMPDGGKLIIKTENQVLSPEYCEMHMDVGPGRYLVLNVTDAGCGIPPEVRERIFEPFFTTKDVGKGAGLGLPMVYGVVQQHEGTIRVYSEVGHGTTFRIYLPTVDHAAGADASAGAPQRVTGGNETILIAEDDPLVRGLAVRLLERAGYTVLAASDGLEAIELFRANQDRIALAVLDVVMPKLGGRDALRRLREIEPDLEAIFCSGYDPEVANEGLDPDEHLHLLQKPFDPQQLLAGIREALDRALCPAAT